MVMKQIQDRGRPECDGTFESVGKRPRTPAMSEEDEEEEMFLAEFSVEEETVKQVMKVLEEEISCPNNKGGVIMDSNPWSSVMCYPPSSSFVTINGNEESCGPSFSDSSSTVMASIDMGGINISYFMGMGPSNGFLPFPGGAPDLPAPAVSAEEEQGWPEIGEVSVSSMEGVMNKGCYSESEVGESEDEWLDRVLSEAPFEFVE